MPYVPNATDTTEPLASQSVESAALEFRTLKTSINSRVTTEIANRVAGDAALQAELDQTQVELDLDEVRITALEQLAFNGSTPGAISVTKFTANGVSAVYTLPVTPITVSTVDVYIRGIHQESDTYSIVGNTLTLSTVPTLGWTIEVKAGVPLSLGITTADQVEYLPAGTGAVARTVQTKLRESVSVEDFGADSTGATDSTASVQAAVNQLQANGVLVFPQGKTIRIDGTVTISVSNVTIDLNNCSFTSGIVSSTPAFAFIPASLVASGRLTGADYPASWKNGSTPLPLDGDFDLMMSENVDANRIKNVSVVGARVGSGCTRTFIKGYSIDGVTFDNCVIEPTNYSAVRLFHCSDIRAGKDNKFGGSGSYTMFLLKCRQYAISATFSSATCIRALSAKGAMHQDGQSIFSDFATSGTYYRYFNSIFDGTILTGIDGVFWDTTPFYTEDAVGARGGTPIGFTSGSWYGKGFGLNVKKAVVSLTNATPGTNGNQQGRAVWASAPHKGVFVDENDFFDCTVFLTGIQNFSIDGNSFRFDRGVGYAWEVQGDSVTATDGKQFSICGNKIYDWQPIGTTVYASRVATNAGTFVKNQLHAPASGTSGFVAWGNNYSGVSDQIAVENNRIFYAVGSPVLGSFGTNNPNGFRSNNVLFNTATGAYSTDGIRTRDVGAAGLGVFASDDATGYAGLSFYNKAGSSIKTQLYWDAAGSKTVLYATPNRVVEMDGGTYFRPAFDNSFTLGASGYRWSTIYAATGTINTSDERTKTEIQTIDDAVLRAWTKVQFCQFKFTDAVEKKGDGARWHFGLIAQRVKEAFEQEGLDAFAYGLLCYDEWPEEAAREAVLDDSGNVVIQAQPCRPAGNRYGIRYEQALALECAYLRSKIA